jgi:hypothetical protein
MIPRYYKSRGVSPWIIKNPINQSTNHEQMRWKIIQSWQCPMGKSMLSNQLVYHHFPVLKISEIWGPSSSSSILSSTQRSYQAGSIPLIHPIKTSHEYIPWTYPMNISHEHIPWISNSSGETLPWSHCLSLKVRKDLPRTWHPPDCREVDPGAPGVWGLLKIYHNWYSPPYE